MLADGGDCLADLRAVADQAAPLATVSPSTAFRRRRRRSRSQLHPDSAPTIGLARRKTDLLGRYCGWEGRSCRISCPACQCLPAEVLVVVNVASLDVRRSFAVGMAYGDHAPALLSCRRRSSRLQTGRVLSRVPSWCNGVLVFDAVDQRNKDCSDNPGFRRRDRAQAADDDYWGRLKQDLTLLRLGGTIIFDSLNRATTRRADIFG